MGMMLHRKASLRKQGAVEIKTAPVVISKPEEEVVEPILEAVEITEDAPEKDVPKSRRRRKNV